MPSSASRSAITTVALATMLVALSPTWLRAADAADPVAMPAAVAVEAAAGADPAAAHKGFDGQSWLYVSFATFQVLDVHSTTRGLSRGGQEANPVMRSIAGSPAALLTVKAGMTALTIYSIQRLRKEHPLAARILMIVENAAYCAVVVHNYSISGPQR